MQGVIIAPIWLGGNYCKRGHYVILDTPVEGVVFLEAYMYSNINCNIVLQVCLFALLNKNIYK